MQGYLTSVKAGLQRFVVANRLSVQILGAKVAWGGGEGGEGKGQYSRCTSR